MNMNVIPVPLVALIGIYAIAKVILDTTRDLHSLRDTILRTRKLEVTHPVDIARIRVTALTNSYIPLWQGICNAHVVLIIVFILIAIFEVGSKSTPITNSIDINNQNIKISIQSTNTIGMNPDNINSQNLKIIDDSINNFLYRGLLIFSAIATCFSLHGYLRAGSNDIRIMDQSICETIRLSEQQRPKVPAYSCWRPDRIFKLLTLNPSYPPFVAENWIAPPEAPPLVQKPAEGVSSQEQTAI